MERGGEPGAGGGLAAGDDPAGDGHPAATDCACGEERCHPCEADAVGVIVWDPLVADEGAQR